MFPYGWSLHGVHVHSFLRPSKRATWVAIITLRSMRVLLQSSSLTDIIYARVPWTGRWGSGFATTLTTWSA